MVLLLHGERRAGRLSERLPTCVHLLRSAERLLRPPRSTLGVGTQRSKAGFEGVCDLSAEQRSPLRLESADLGRLARGPGTDLLGVRGPLLVMSSELVQLDLEPLQRSRAGGRATLACPELVHSLLELFAGMGWLQAELSTLCVESHPDRSCFRSDLLALGAEMPHALLQAGNRTAGFRMLRARIVERLLDLVHPCALHIRSLSQPLQAVLPRFTFGTQRRQLARFPVQGSTHRLRRRSAEALRERGHGVPQPLLVSAGPLQRPPRSGEVLSGAPKLLSRAHERLMDPLRLRLGLRRFAAHGRDPRSNRRRRCVRMLLGAAERARLALDELGAVLFEARLSFAATEPGLEHVRLLLGAAIRGIEFSLAEHEPRNSTLESRRPLRIHGTRDPCLLPSPEQRPSLSQCLGGGCESFPGASALLRVQDPNLVDRRRHRLLCGQLFSGGFGDRRRGCALVHPRLCLIAGEIAKLTFELLGAMGQPALRVE